MPDTVSRIIAYENDKLSETDMIEFFQELINSGLCWKLQGHYGRTAMTLIESGYCILGKTGHKDYYGNYVPSQTEVEPGTKGSMEYQKKILGEG